MFGVFAIEGGLAALSSCLVFVVVVPAFVVYVVFMLDSHVDGFTMLRADGSVAYCISLL